MSEQHRPEHFHVMQWQSACPLDRVSWEAGTWLQLLNAALYVRAKALLADCVFIFLKGKGLRIYLCASTAQSQISLAALHAPHLNKLFPAVTLTLGLFAADNKWAAQPASPSAAQSKKRKNTKKENNLYTHSQEESDVHTPTCSGKHKRTDTYTLWRGRSWRCVLCNSGVKWSPTPTRP